MKPILATALVIFTAVAQAQDRLLPQDEAAQFRVSHRQDGRAVYVKVVNGSGMVLTTAELSCEHAAPQPRPAPAAADRALSQDRTAQQEMDQNPHAKYFAEALQPPKSGWQPNYHGHIVARASASVRSRVQEKLLPGKNVEVYLEVPAGEEVDDCRLGDLRGRAKKFYEF
jgi:hypothetical protein